MSLQEPAYQWKDGGIHRVMASAVHQDRNILQGLINLQLRLWALCYTSQVVM